MPDSTTVQNVWSRPPSQEMAWSLGANFSWTWADLKDMSKSSDNGFGGRNIDLTEFPEKWPYLPAIAVDLRFGIQDYSWLDFGLAGMFVNPQWLPVLQDLLGEDADFTYVTAGLDVRLAIFDERGRFFITSVKPKKDVSNKVERYSYSMLIPSLTFQTGYYFTFMKSAFTSAEKEEVDIGFRTDSYTFGLQLAWVLGDRYSYIKNIGTGAFFSPYFGGKYIISATDTDFSWTTGRPVRVNGGEYPAGAKYYSGDMQGELQSYFQIYGGTGITLGFLNFTVGLAYNVVTEHFGVTAALRSVFPWGFSKILKDTLKL
jgi:hypothetical protein